MSNDFSKAFTFVGDHWSLLSDKSVEHLIISGEAIGISILIGVPIGVVLGHLHRFSFIAINTANIARALPSLALLGILLPYTGIGDTTIIIALVVLAAPPILTNAYVAVDQVDADIVDAAKGLGLRPWQVLLSVEMPLALPIIFAGIRVAAVFVVATATLKGFFGHGGLGEVIADPSSYGIAGVVGASYVLIAIAVLTQLLFVALEYAVTPAGARRPSTRRRRFRNVLGASRGAERSPTPEAATADEAEQDQPMQGSLTR